MFILCGHFIDRTPVIEKLPDNSIFKTSPWRNYSQDFGLKNTCYSYVDLSHSILAGTVIAIMAVL